VADIRSVLIVGTGLIGTSLALALRRVGIDVLLTDRDQARCVEASAMGAGRVASDVEPDVVIVCVPPRETAAVLAEQATLHPAATLMDVASIKGPVIAEADRLGVPMERFVGSHPMAGRELSGPSAARADLVDDRLWILTPEDASADHVAKAESIVRLCGGVAVVMSAHDHDEAVALVSHTPQVLASVLAAQLTDAADDQVSIAGQGLRDMTRIAGSSTELWREILLGNAEPVARVLRSIIGTLGAVQGALETAQEDAVEAMLVAGADGQQRIPGKHGAQASPYVEIAVMVEDRPGQLAGLVVAAGDAGINLEDVRIEHVLGRPSGLIELAVRPEHGDRLAAVLRAAGFDVRT
jgi:prephenate dehydrogenase